ncbi:TadE/TadG family type IV pilus assembly protein [Sphingomonas sp.]|uniref:TadE/TadG family type IV pilus assembly protein n=1 Tax=Sphingomonas sp. TaxID=28214 RepID=UPI00333F57DE
MIGFGAKPDWLRRFAREERGIALLEFAFVLPFLVLLFLGGFQLMDAMSAYRKVGSTVRTLADLTTQNTTMTAADADEILNASRQVMAPYSPSSAALRISQIQIDGTGRATISWSRPLNCTAYATGAVVTMPTGLSTPNSYYIFSEINYTYTPGLASSLIGTIPLTQTIYMSPRNSAFVAYN